MLIVITCKFQFLVGVILYQTFAVLVPIGITKKYSVAIRTFVTNDFMTGRPAAIGTEADYYGRAGKGS